MMLREALNCRNSLRREFEEFIQPMVPGGINWLEVDSLINVLTRTKAPPEKLTRMGLRPAQHIRDESYSDYRVYSQERACQLPILMHGAVDGALYYDGTGILLFVQYGERAKRDVIWSWGIKLCVKDYSKSQFRTLVIGYDVYAAINSGLRGPYTVLLTGRGNKRPDSTISI